MEVLELEERMAHENQAAEELRKVREIYLADRIPKNRAAYLRALNEFSKLVSGRE